MQESTQVIETDGLNLERFGKLTDIQRSILEYYYETFNIFKACELVGVGRSYIYNARSQHPNTPFVKAYKAMTKELENDPRIGKLGGIENLKDIAKRAKEAGRLDIEIKVQQEINKMVERNLAVQKKSVETVNIDVKGVIDLVGGDAKQLEQPIEDVDYDVAE